MTATTLYPLKFNPILQGRIWGGEKLQTVLNKPLNNQKNIGESWEISGVDDNISVVSNGFLKENNLNEIIEIYMGDLVGERIFQKYGEEFPLLIKFLDAREDLSIQVHPNDELASTRHQSFGKSEMWYVMQSEEGSELISGFSKSITRKEYVKAVEDNNIDSLLAKHSVKPGDVFYIPAGRVHAIGAGILIAEIQQTSDITYRIFDFNRKDANGNFRELHTELAVDAIDFNLHDDYRTQYTSVLNRPTEVLRSPYFDSKILDATEPLVRDYYYLDSFVILICMYGSAIIEYGDNAQESINMGETVLIPAELRQIAIIPESKTRIMEISIPLED
jgi:mannose-6-phosphate isomerase